MTFNRATSRRCISYKVTTLLFCRFYCSGFRIRKARVRKCNRFPRQKGGHGPRRSMRRPWKLRTRTRPCCSLVTYKGADLFSERVGPRVIFLKASQVSSCSKRSREITTLTESIEVLTKIDSQ